MVVVVGVLGHVGQVVGRSGESRGIDVLQGNRRARGELQHVVQVVLGVVFRYGEIALAIVEIAVGQVGGQVFTEPKRWGMPHGPLVEVRAEGPGQDPCPLIVSSDSADLDMDARGDPKYECPRRSKTRMPKAGIGAVKSGIAKNSADGGEHTNTKGEAKNSAGAYLGF